jgi:hypothetical protein
MRHLPTGLLLPSGNPGYNAGAVEVSWKVVREF